MSESAIGRAILPLGTPSAAERPGNRSFLPTILPMCSVSVAVVLSAFLMLASPAAQADNVWVGGGGNGNFSTAANWQATPSWSYADDLVFSVNTTAPSLVYDISPQVVDDIFFATTWPGSRTLQATGGGVLYFRQRLENLSSYTQTISMPLLGGNDGAVNIQLNPVNGSLVINDDLYNDFALDYAIFGSSTATVPSLVLNTAIGLRASSQAGIDFVIAGGGRNVAVQVNTSQIWAGRTELQAGSFTTANGVALASSDILITAGTLTTTSANTFADSATLRINGGLLSVGGSDVVGSLAGNGGTVDLASGATLTAGGANTSTSYAGAITGSGGLTKAGTGTLTLSGSNAYTGVTTVGGGRLAVSSSLGNTAVSVQSGGTLSGSGSIAGTIGVLSGGTLAPGNSIESLAGGATIFAGGSTFAYEYDSTNPASLAAAADLLVVSGDLTIDSGALITFADLAVSPQSFVEDTTIFSLINYSGEWNGGLFTYDSTVLTDGSRFIVGDQEWEIAYALTSPAGLDNFTGNYLPDSKFVAITAVPEPATYLLTLPAICWGGLLLRRRRRSKVPAHDMVGA